jgi:hypothetical protein
MFGSRSQRRYLSTCGMFAKQAKEEGRAAEFMAQCSARYYAKWPLPRSTIIGAEVKRTRHVSLRFTFDLLVSHQNVQEMKKQIQWSAYCALNINLPIHWESMFALDEHRWKAIEVSLKHFL